MQYFLGCHGFGSSVVRRWTTYNGQAQDMYLLRLQGTMGFNVIIDEFDLFNDTVLLSAPNGPHFLVLGR